ncbi:MAG: zinc ribbon domain-containing protein [Bacillota bacterium]
MWETIKNDPVLKYVSIVILSVLGFGLAFNIMFGPRSNGSEHGMGMDGGYSLENTLSYILAIGVKLLLIAIVIAALVTVFKFITKGSNQGGESKMLENMKNDPVLKAAAVAVLLAVTLGLTLMLLGGIFGNGNIFGINSHNMMGVQVTTLGLSDVLTYLLQLLLFVSIVGLVIGAFMFIKQNYSKQIIEKFTVIKASDRTSIDCPKCSMKVSDSFKFCPECGEKLKTECASCGMELVGEWKCCPNCGVDKV